MYISAEELKQAIAAIAHIPLTLEEDSTDQIDSPEYLLRGNFADNTLLLTVINPCETGFARLKASEPSDDDDPSSQSDGNEFIVSFGDFCSATQDCLGDVELIIRDGDLAVIYQGVREWVLKQPIAFPRNVFFPPPPNLVIPTLPLIQALEPLGDESVWLYVQDLKLHVAGSSTVTIDCHSFQPSLDRPDPYSLVTASLLLEAVRPHSQQPSIELSIDGFYLAVQGLDNVMQGVLGFQTEGKTPPHHAAPAPEPVKQRKAKKANHLSVVPDPVPVEPEPEPIAVLEVPVCVTQARTAIDQFLEDLDRLSEAGDEALYLISIQTLRDNLSAILPKATKPKAKPKAQVRAKTVKPKTQKKPKAVTHSDRTPVVPSEKLAELKEIYDLKQQMTAAKVAEIFTGRGRPMGDTTIAQYVTTYKMLLNSETSKNLFLSGQVKWSDIYAMSRKVNQWGIEKIEEYLLDKAKQSA